MPDQMPMMRAKPKRTRKGKRAGVVPMPMAPAMREHPKYLMGEAEWPGFKPGIRGEMAKAAKRQRQKRRKAWWPGKRQAEQAHPTVLA